MFISMHLRPFLRVLKTGLVTGSLVCSAMTLASSPGLHIEPVKSPFSVLIQPETDKQFTQRMAMIRQVVEQYDINLRHVYLFVGKEKREEIRSRQLGKQKVTYVRKRSPTYFTELYRVGNSKHQFVYLNRRTGHATSYDLADDDVKPLSSLPSVEHRVLMNNIHEKSSENRARVIQFAKRLVKENICHTVHAAAVYQPRRVTAFCGDGMEYSLTLDQVAAHAPIEQRVVRQYASFK